MLAVAVAIAVVISVWAKSHELGPFVEHMPTDSAQNRLIGLQMHLGMARELSAEKSPELAATLDRLLDDAVAVGDELRRIGQGISPPPLATLGLAAALTAEATHSAIPVRVSADDQRAAAPGAGLTGIRDRIHSFGGRIEIVAEPGVGTTATGRVPWPPRAA